MYVSSYLGQAVIICPSVSYDSYYLFIFDAKFSGFFSPSIFFVHINLLHYDLS